MCITLGSGYVLSPSPSGSASILSQLSIPFDDTSFLSCWHNSSLTKTDEAFLNRLICFFVKSPSNPQMEGSIAKSISSEKRCMTFQTLLSDVPPLNTKCFATGNEKTCCSTTVTHKSFSTACTGSPVLLAACESTIRCCSVDN